MCALPAREREEVRRLLELVPDEDLPTVRRMLRGLIDEDACPEGSSWGQVLAAFDSAPEDDEGELSEEMVAKLADADRAVSEGRVFTDEEVQRRLGL